MRYVVWNMSPGSPHKEYLSQRVAAASPMELIRILYESAMQAVEEALEAFRSGDILRRGNSVTKAIELISELRLSLRREVHPAYCDTLGGLYSYLQRQLIRAHAEKSESLFQEVRRLLQTLLDGWIGAMQNVNARELQDVSAQTESKGSVRPASSSTHYEPTDAASAKRSWQF